MAPETSNKSVAAGMNPLTKDRFDVASKAVAIIGGLISALILILTLDGNREQRASELRWNQTKLAMQLLDEMLSDPQSFNALRMIDWDNRDYQIEGKRVVIDAQEVQEALNVKNNSKLPPNGVFIRESFDRLFYHLGKLKRSLKSKLIMFEDVYSPMDYYVHHLRSRYGEVLVPYMEQLHHMDALEFMSFFSPPQSSYSPTAAAGRNQILPSQSWTDIGVDVSGPSRGKLP